MPNLAEALLGLQSHAVSNQTQVSCMCGTDHPSKIHLIPEAFHTLQDKNCAADTTADLTIFGISIAQIDGFPLYNIHTFQSSISLAGSPVQSHYLLLKELLQQLQ